METSVHPDGLLWDTLATNPGLLNSGSTGAFWVITSIAWEVGESLEIKWAVQSICYNAGTCLDLLKDTSYSPE